MANILNKNILDVKEGLILHGVNCQRVMGAGLAKQLKSKYPDVYYTYLETIPQLGAFVPIQVTTRLWVGNCYTQKNYGRDPLIQYANYAALKTALEDAVIFAEANNLSIHSPIIGSGLGNGDRDTILKIYENYPTITLYELII